MKKTEASRGSDIWFGGCEFVAGHRHGTDPPADLQEPNVGRVFEKALKKSKSQRVR